MGGGRSPPSTLLNANVQVLAADNSDPSSHQHNHATSKTGRTDCSAQACRQFVGRTAPSLQTQTGELRLNGCCQTDVIPRRHKSTSAVRLWEGGRVRRQPGHLPGLPPRGLADASHPAGIWPTEILQAYFSSSEGLLLMRRLAREEEGALLGLLIT